MKLIILALVILISLTKCIQADSLTNTDQLSNKRDIVSFLLDTYGLTTVWPIIQQSGPTLGNQLIALLSQLVLLNDDIESDAVLILLELADNLKPNNENNAVLIQNAINEITQLITNAKTTTKLPPTLPVSFQLLGHYTGGDYIAAIEDLLALPNGNLVSCSRDNTMRVWDLDTRSELFRLTGHKDDCLALALLSNGNLVSGSADRTIRVWDLETKKELFQLKNTEWVSALATHPNGNLVSADYSDYGSSVRVWDLDTRSQLFELKGHKKGISSLVVLKNGNVVSASWDESIRVWDLNTKSLSFILHDKDLYLGFVYSLALLPNGNLAAGYNDKVISVWDLDTKKELYRLKGHESGVSDLAILPNGNLASASRYRRGTVFQDFSVRIWDLGNKREIFRHKASNYSILSLAALPNGNLVYGQENAVITVLETGRMMNYFN